MTEMNYSNVQIEAKELVANYLNKELQPTRTIRPFDIYVVWYCKTLNHAKVLLSTDLVDGYYFEVTYNGAKREYYLDAYTKQHNEAVRREEIRI